MASCFGKGITVESVEQKIHQQHPAQDQRVDFKALRIAGENKIVDDALYQPQEGDAGSGGEGNGGDAQYQPLFMGTKISPEATHQPQVLTLQKLSQKSHCSPPSCTFWVVRLKSQRSSTLMRLETSTSMEATLLSKSCLIRKRSVSASTAENTSSSTSNCPGA